MGYTTQGSIKSYWPDNTETTLYLASDSSTSLSDMLERIRDHFGEDVDLSQLRISSEYIHTDCLTYDRYDPGDYTNFIIIEKI